MITRPFFTKNPVFTLREFSEFLNSHGSPNPDAQKALLKYHIRAGHILGIRRGIYAVVPSGVEPGDAPLDGFLIAAKMAEDAVLAYHTALDIHGRAHSIREEFIYSTNSRKQASTRSFRGLNFRGVLFPKPLRQKRQELFCVERIDRAGLPLRVTNLERTLVDIFDRPSLGGGWEEIWRSLETVEYFDIDELINYAVLLENSTTAAKVGFYLETRRQELMLDERHLKRLREYRPKAPIYMVPSGAARNRTKNHLIKDWNLLVPESILRRTWEEAF